MIKYISIIVLSFLTACLSMASDLGDWKLMKKNLPRGLFCHQAVVVDHRVYVIGGHGSGRRLADVWMVEVDQDGNLGDWKRCPSLPPGKAGFMFHSATVWKNVIYVLGGSYIDEERETGQTAEVWFTQVNQGGTLDGWKRTSSLPEPRLAGEALSFQNRMYYLGGQYKREVYMADISPDGQLGKWNAISKLPTILSSSFAFFDKGYLFVIGGNILINRNSHKAFRAEVKPDGMLKKFRRTESLPEPSVTCNTIKNGDDIIVIGGNENDAIYQSTVESDRHLGDWRKVGELPQKGMKQFQAVKVANHVFLLGGIIMGTPNKVLNSIYRTTLK